MHLAIREFREKDVPAANALTNTFIQGTHIHFAFEPASDAEFRLLWIRAQGRFPWLAAAVDGQFAGYAKAGPWRDRDAYRFTAETTLYVNPGFHRRGIGRALMVELLDRLTSAGFHTAVAGVSLPNPASIALHEALGFRHIGTFS